MSAGQYNTAMGYQALCDSIAWYSTAIGGLALLRNTTGTENVAVGYEALRSNTSGSYNIGIGVCAGREITTGSTNTAIGKCALASNQTADDSTAIGVNSLANQTTGARQTSIGVGSLVAVTTGGCNTSVGVNTLSSVTTGTENTAIGFQAGGWATVLTTGSHNTFLGAYGSPANNSDNCSLVVNATSQTIGKGSGTGFIDVGGGGSIYQGNNSSSWATTSDARLKKNIVDNNQGLEKVSQIQVRNFEYRTKDEITDLPTNQVIEKEGIQLGVIAQELETIAPEMVKTESTGVKTVDSDNLIWYLVNSIKELKSRIEELESN